MRARCPGSAANLGPGFDTLAIALDLSVEVTVEPASKLVVRSRGEGSELPAGASHLAARVASKVVGHDKLAIDVSSQVPVRRGLGSSAAIAVAAAAASGAKDPLAVAASFEGHPENAAASVRGGLVAAASVLGEAVAVSLPLDPGLRFVVLVPHRPLLTKDARQVLPSGVSFERAKFNLGRMGLLVAGLADRSLLQPEFAEDQLHQQARAALFPEADQLLASLIDAGALASCWSGAGPSLLAFCDINDGEEVRARGEAMLASTGVGGDAMLLEANAEGLSVAGS